MLDADAPLNCENCATPLEGAYCHACGQHAVNPLRHFAHAFEELFESFWHLDGRAFRTFRDLLVPGRVACNYLAGQRARYIPPLRLFLVLTVVTFFVGQFVVNAGADASPQKAGASDSLVQLDLGDGDGEPSTIEKARTPAEVLAMRDKAIAGMEAARRSAAAPYIPGMKLGLGKTEAEVRAKADARLAQLGVKAVPGVVSGAPGKQVAGGAGVPAAVTDAEAKAGGGTSKPPTNLGKTGAEVADTVLRKSNRAHLKDPKHPWDATANPVHFDGLPTLADHWLNHRIANVADNIDRMIKRGQGVFFELMLAAVPSALFLLVPVFALLLRVFYPFSGRSYLEQLVIALYSHAFLLLTLFATFVLMLLPLPETLAGWGVGLLWMWAAAYVLLMQKRVYGQRWPITTLKYLGIGFLYQFLLFGGLLYAVFAGISSSD